MKSALIFLFCAIVFVGAMEDEESKIVEMEETSRGGCPKCSTKEAPTCGFNGRCARWFTNPCYLKAYNCYNNERFAQCDNSMCQSCCRLD